MPHRVSKERFAELVEKALAEVPAEFALALEEVAIEIRDRPSEQQQRKLKLPANSILLGLYHGQPRTKRSVEDPYRLPEVIYIFQENIERVCDSEPQLIVQVRTTVLHELGHHFGMDEKDLDDLGYG